MIPGMNQRQMKQAMKRMGMQQQEIEATEVIIRTSEKEYYFPQPQVAKINMMGQDTWQITGDFEERSLNQEIEISDEDVDTVAEQTGVDKDTARAKIKECEGDLSQAIMQLSSEE